MTPPIKNIENLFTLLDANYDQHYDGTTFWRELHALDKELTPGCIYAETFTPSSAKNLRTGDNSAEDFLPNQKTIVFRVTHRQAALQGAKLLNKIFRDTGTRFIAEAEEKGGSTEYRIRSNIDKAHWEKLCVFCKYRFDREISHAGDRKKLQAECQQTLDAYTKGTNAEGWDATEGIPAFLAVMGFHGNLRPKERYAPDCHRIEHELNMPHPHGTPLVFKGVIMHANMNRRGQIQCTTPYDFVYDPNRVAYADATNDKRYHELLLETCGGNPFEKGLSLTRRAVFTIGLSLGLYGLSQGAHEIIGVIGPAASVAAGGMFFVVTFVNHRWKVLERISTIQKNGKHHHVQSTVLGNGKVVEDGKHVTSELHTAYTRDGGPDAELEREAFSSRGMNQLARAIVEAGKRDPLDLALKTEVVKSRG